MRYRLDTRGLRCPLPVRLAAQQANQMTRGDELEVVGDDPVLPIDLEAWCHDAGHRLLERSGLPPEPGPILYRIQIVDIAEETA